MEAPPLRIGYIVHDLADPAVERRVRMLRRGGAEVALAGFHRTPAPPPAVAGVVPVPLGRTADGKLAARALSVVGSRLQHRRIAAALGPVDALMARNLEALAIATAMRRDLARSSGRARARKSGERDVPLTYELLDIHRLLLGRKGAPFRALEGRLARQCQRLIVSSPAFVSAYVEPLSRMRLPVELVENKLIAAPAGGVAVPPAGPPWRVGLFGALRDRHSIAVLGAAAARLGGTLQVDIRGKPSPAVFDDFAALVAGHEHMHFAGPYRMPDDLAELYGAVHFIWCIDYYEAGANSEWLLPNRLYEGGAHGAVPIARAGTATAARLEALGIGHVLHGDPAEALAAVLATMTAERWAEMRAAVTRLAPSTFVTDDAECGRLVDIVAARSAPSLTPAAEAA